jgi:hypothetical protein
MCMILWRFLHLSWASQERPLCIPPQTPSKVGGVHK